MRANRRHRTNMGRRNQRRSEKLTSRVPLGTAAIMPRCRCAILVRTRLCLGCSPALCPFVLRPYVPGIASHERPVVRRSAADGEASERIAHGADNRVGLAEAFTSVWSRRSTPNISPAALEAS